MKLPINLTWPALGVALLCVATDSSALTLGRARGAAVLGQPLELTVAIEVGPDEDISSLCFDADVFYGDTRQDANRIKVRTQTLPQSSSASVKVQAYANVNEPVVTVYLRAGCGLQTTRRYVLLADLASEVTPLVVTRPDNLASAGQAPATMARSQNTATALPADTTRSVADPVGRPRTAKPSKRATELRSGELAALPRKPESAAKMPAQRTPRLTLTPLDLTLDLDPSLKLSDELATVPEEDLEKRAQAAAWWRALNASPEDVLRDAARLAAMQADLKLQQDLASKNRQTLANLALRLEAVEAQRYANPLVYGLLALLAACGAGAAWLWFRLRSANLGAAPWWRGPNHANVEVEQSTNEIVSVHPVGMPVAKTTVASEKLSAGLTEVDIDLQLQEPVPAPVAQTAPQAAAVAASLRAEAPLSGHRDFENSVNRSMREISTQDMLDARQQSDFFMALGQYDAAIDVLERCIRESAESNPLVYLDLLGVFHTLSRKDEYDAFRAEFNGIFAGRVPAYAEFSRPSNGLESYPEVCSQISALWPSEEASAFIEQCLVRSPDEHQPQKGFDLEAFRDLLMLYGVVQRVVSTSDAQELAFSTSKPLNISSQRAAFAVAPSDAAIPRSSESVRSESSVDLDLSESADNLIDFDMDGAAAEGTPRRN